MKRTRSPPRRSRRDPPSSRYCSNCHATNVQILCQCSSKLSLHVQQMLNPGGAVSPKRNPLGDLSAAAGPAGAAGGPPKLNFLAQLTARVKSASVDAGNPGNMAAEVTKSITTTAKSLFADIARFRKSEDEVAVVGSGSAEDKENSARSNTVGEHAVITI